MSSLSTDSFVLACDSHIPLERRRFVGKRNRNVLRAPDSSVVVFRAAKFQYGDWRVSILQSKLPNGRQHRFVVSQNPAQMFPLLFRQSLAILPNNVGELRLHVPALLRSQLWRRRFLLARRKCRRYVAPVAPLG